GGGPQIFGLVIVALPSATALALGGISRFTGAMLATTTPVFLPLASREKISVATLTFAPCFESLSTFTCKFTLARSGDTSGVISCVPQCPTWTGEVLTSHTLR